MADDLDIRPYVDSDLPQVVDLMAAALGETSDLKRTPERFAWKHLENPFGQSIILLAMAGSQVVGLRTFMRWNLRFGSEQLNCVRAVDTATHPKFQRRGIFRTLTMSGIEVAEAEGVHMVFNTPNAKSRPGYLKMGWLDVGPIPVQARPHFRYLADKNVSQWGTPADAVSVESVVEGWLGRSESVLLETPASNEYVRWRFDRNPSASYRAHHRGKGAAVVRYNFRSGKRETVISHLFGENPTQALREAIRAAKGHYAVASFLKGSQERKTAMRAGLLPVPRLAALRLVARPLTDMPVDVFEMGSWKLGLSDLELL